MLQVIGLMVGSYAIVRMVSLATRTGERSEPGLVRVLAILNVFFTLWLISLLFSSNSSPS